MKVRYVTFFKDSTCSTYLKPKTELLLQMARKKKSTVLLDSRQQNIYFFSEKLLLNSNVFKTKLFLKQPRTLIAKVCFSHCAFFLRPKMRNMIC